MSDYEKIKTKLGKLENKRRREDSLKILEIMRDVINEEVKLWEDHYIGFGDYRYINKTNQGDMPKLAFVTAKAHITIYFAVGGLDPYKEYLDRIGKYRRGKICLYISNMDKIDVDVFRELIRSYWDDVESGKAIYS